MLLVYGLYLLASCILCECIILMLPQNSEWCTVCIMLSFEISTTFYYSGGLNGEIMVELHSSQYDCSGTGRDDVHLIQRPSALPCCHWHCRDKSQP